MLVWLETFYTLFQNANIRIFWKKTDLIFHFLQKANLKCKTTKNNIISSYKEDYFFDRKIREDRVLDALDRLF